MSEIDLLIEELEDIENNPIKPFVAIRIGGYLRNYKYHEYRIAELEASQRWIPVSERLPELDQDVLAIVEGDIVTGHFYQQWDGEIYFSSDDEGAMMVATHWMPLPQPPEVKK